MQSTQKILKSRNVCGKNSNVICMVSTKKRRNEYGESTIHIGICYGRVSRQDL